MECVTREFDPELEHNYLVWQDATQKFIQSLTSTAENLNRRNQLNGNRKVNNNTSTVGVGPIARPKDRNGTVVIDNEEEQLSGATLKTAIYKPVPSTSSRASSTSSINQIPSVDPFNFMFGDILNPVYDDAAEKEDSGEGKRLYERSGNNGWEL